MCVCDLYPRTIHSSYSRENQLQRAILFICVLVTFGFSGEFVGPRQRRKLCHRKGCAWVVQTFTAHRQRDERANQRVVLARNRVVADPFSHSSCTRSQAIARCCGVQAYPLVVAHHIVSSSLSHVIGLIRIAAETATTTSITTTTTTATLTTATQKWFVNLHNNVENWRPLQLPRTKFRRRHFFLIT